MNTILLAVGAYLLLSPKSSSTAAPTTAPTTTNTSRPTSSSELGDAFGAFVGGLIRQATKD